MTTKICRLCGKEFEPKVWNATICSEDHYKTCEICGKQYKVKKDEKVVDIEKRKTCYNPECIRIQRNKTHNINHSYHKTCIICGEEFEATRHNINICQKEHYRTCSICGEDFILKPEAHIDRLLNRNFCYKPECIEKHKSILIKGNENVQREWFGNEEKIYHKICIICGEEFISKSPKRTYCYNEHHRTCSICGKDFILKFKTEGGSPTKVSRQINRKICYDPECKKEQDRRIQQEIFNKNYNGKHFMSTDEFKEKARNTRYRLYGSYLNMENYKKNGNRPEVQEKIRKTLKERYGITNPLLIHPNRNMISKVNIKFSKLLDIHNIKYEIEFPIEDRSYDFKIKDSNILLEINPSYTHNIIKPPEYVKEKKHMVSKQYHLEKTKLAEKNSYRCIHIWDWDNKYKVINLINPNKIKLRGRQVELREISPEEANSFLDKYHIQNSCKGNIVNLGLFYNNELIEVTTFGRPRYNKNYEWEWLRLASNYQFTIMGGIGKFWKYFQEKYQPKSIITYIDNSKFGKDNFLNNFGFKLIDYGKPTAHWYKRNGRRHITDNLLRQRGADQLLGTNYGKPEICNMTNEDVMIKEGFLKVYDCGQSTWIWNKD